MRVLVVMDSRKHTEKEVSKVKELVVHSFSLFGVKKQDITYVDELFHQGVKGVCDFDCVVFYEMEYEIMHLLSHHTVLAVFDSLTETFRFAKCMQSEKGSWYVNYYNASLWIE